MSEPDRRDDQVHEGLAQALGEKKTRIMDTRFLFLLGFVTVALVFLGTAFQVQLAHVRAYQRSQHAICVAQSDAMRLLSQSALTNRQRTQAQNLEISKAYAALVQECP